MLPRFTGAIATKVTVCIHDRRSVIVDVINISKRDKDVARTERMNVRRILLDSRSAQGAEPILEPVGVRQRTRDRPAGPEHSENLLHQALRATEMLEELGGHDDVEARIA